MARRLRVVKSPPIDRLLTPWQKFMQMEAGAGILLLVCTVVALVWANIPEWGDVYKDLLEIKLGFALGDYIDFNLSIHHWINDALMAIFFFVVGMEIKREVLVGELASVRRASLPFIAAAGGMVVPALIFVAFNYDDPTDLRGWGVPMATDIAFAVGVMALLGRHAPLPLKVFLMAVAIVDDIGAVLVIAFFYTDDLNLIALAIGGGFLGALIVTNVLGVRRPVVYLLIGIGLWFAFYESGVHATIAGVLSAMTIPAKVRINEEEFAHESEQMLQQFKAAIAETPTIVHSQKQQHAVHSLEKACEQVQPVLLRLEHSLVPWIGYLIMPLFALANAGVQVGGDFTQVVTSSIAMGIASGLVIGKIVGVTGATLIAVKTGIGDLPKGTSWRQVIGVSALAGIGFTMSLFIAQLAYKDPSMQLTAAKVGILGGSLVAGVFGFILLRTAPTPPPQLPGEEQPLPPKVI